jgi:hypothetical protein
MVGILGRKLETKEFFEITEVFLLLLKRREAK